MSYKARILIVGDDSGGAGGLAATLRENGFQTVAANGPGKALRVARDKQPDAVIIDADQETETDLEAAFDLAQKLKGDDPATGAPVILIGPQIDATGEAEGFAAGINIYLSKPYHQAQLLSRLHSLVRLVTMRGELARRAATAAKYGISRPLTVPPQADGADPEVLVVAAATGDFAKIEKILSAGVTLTHELSAGSALDHLISRPSDAVIINADDDGDALRLCGDIRRISRLYNMPVLIIADRDSFDDPEQPFKAGASDVVYRPIRGVELSARVKMFVGEERYRGAMQAIYHGPKHFLTGDALTGLYSYGFALEHLGHEIEDAEAAQRHLTIGVFDVRNMAAVNAEHGYAAGDRLIRQIGNLIGNLLRGEDMAARLGGQEFLVVLPGTEIEGGRNVVQRIASVVNATEFMVSETSEAVSIRLRSGSTSVRDGDSPEMLITRARDSMD